MRTLIRDVRVFDGQTVIERADVLIDGSAFATYEGGPVDLEISGSGRTVLPGLIDSHTHNADGDLAEALKFGVTTELDMFSLPPNTARQRRTALEDDKVADIRSSGILATAPSGHPSQIMAQAMSMGMGDAAGPFPTVADPSQAKAFVAARVADGADYLKVVVDDGSMMGAQLPVLDPATIAALTAAGHDAGLKVIAHVATSKDTVIALDAGVDGIAHVVADTLSDDLVTRIAAHDVFVVSTLVYTAGMSLDAGPNARALHAAGIPLLAGTDANFVAPAHGASMHQELFLLTQAGLSPAEALAAATSVPAHHFGLTDRGRIAAGYQADLVLVEGDPATDITATKSIVDVWRRGVRR